MAARVAGDERKREASVVIPAFRAASTIGRTLESCLGSFDPADIHIVLDGPDAGIEAMARAVVPDAAIVVLPAGSGAPACRNAGLAQVKTPFVMFLDADDYIEGPVVGAACNVCSEEKKDLALAPCAIEWPDGRRRLVRPAALYGAGGNELIMRRWLSGNFIPPCSVIWRTGFVRAIDGWDEQLAKNQDGDLIYRALMAAAQIAMIEQGAGVYSQHDNPLRITRTVNERTLTSQIAVLDKIRINAPGLGWNVSAELARAYYDVARQAFGAGPDHIGHAAYETSRRLGLRGQPGSLCHTVGAALLGLKCKQKAARFLHGIWPSQARSTPFVTNC